MKGRRIGRGGVGRGFGTPDLDGVSTASVGCLVIAAPLLLGGAHAWGALSIACMTALATVLVCGSAQVRRRNDRLPWMSLVLAVPLAWTALQAVPVECAAMEAIAPGVVARTLGTLELLPDPNPACTVSYDPGSTRLEILKGLTLLAAIACGWMLAAAGNRRAVLKWAGLSSATVAAVAAIHRLAGATRVFGLYEPQHVFPPVWGPLLNANHLSGLLAMGLPCTLVLGMSSQTQGRRSLWLCSAGLITCVAFATLSRAGIAALVVSEAGLFWLVHRRKAAAVTTRVSVALLAFAGAVSAAILLNAESLLKEIESEDVTKLEIIADSLRFTLQQPWLGVGRGAFSAGFAGVEEAPLRFVYPESLPVQWVSEWGYPVGLLSLGIAITAWTAALRRARSLERIAALVGVGAIFVHDLLDFALEMIGIAVVAGVLFGAGVAPRRSSRKQASERRHREGPPAVAVSLGITASLMLWALAEGPSLLRTDLAKVPASIEHALESGVGNLAVDEVLHESLQAHPNEARLTLLAAHILHDHEGTEALRWLNRTMQLAPSWPAPHLLVARWLHDRGRNLQALLEVREANARHANSGRTLFCQILARTPQPAMLVERTIPQDEGAADDYLRAAVRCLSDTPDVVAALDAVWTREVPEALEPRLRDARRSFASGDREQAIAQLRDVVDAHPEDLPARRQLAQFLFQTGRSEDALDVLSMWRGASMDWATLTLRGAIEASLGLRAEVERTLEHLTNEAAGDAQGIARASDVRSSLEERMGRLGAALDAAEEAGRMAPTVQRLRRLARLAELAGARFRARQAYARLCQLEPGNVQYCGASGGGFSPHP